MPDPIHQDDDLTPSRLGYDYMAPNFIYVYHSLADPQCLQSLLCEGQ